MTIRISRTLSQRKASLRGLALVAVAALALAGCKAAPTIPATPPVAKATAEVLNLHSSGQHSDYDGACQTNGIVEFRAWDGSGHSGAAGEPFVLEWKFEVDRGFGIEPAPDWGGQHVFAESNTGVPLEQRTVALNLVTIGTHHVTLTVRTRDGRRASTQLRILVTICESCG